MKTNPVCKLIYRLILWALAIGFFTTSAGQFFAVLCAVFLLSFVARLVLALAWRLFVGFVLVLVIILLIL